MDSVPPGEEVAVLGPYQDQVLIERASGLTGWMGRDRFDAPRPAPPAPERAPELQVTTSGVTLRLPSAQGLGRLAVPTPVLAGGTSAGLAAFAGQWAVRTLSPEQDGALSTFRLSATPTTQGWSMVLPGRGDPIPLDVAAGGDSVVIRAGPYASVFRDGMSVETEIVTRLVNGRLEGSQVVRYQGTGAASDSVLTLRLWGTRSR
jgi:hypothetical protein